MFQKKVSQRLEIPSNTTWEVMSRSQDPTLNHAYPKGRREDKLRRYPLKSKKGTPSRALSNAYTTAGQLLSLKNNLRDRSPNEEHDVPFRNNNRQA